ncbi:XVIPCD domain-containing protein [Lysobacter hankyongensis]|uniref:X-Tfes XVIPCD domain-containing protein n=1 Tax=Lysobacter hankyongensis TaxID=1176535 RepID=A0ABP9AK61_9GAMM
MSNGYLLADTNSLIYAYRAGGPELLDEYIKVADGQQREFAITRTVLDEIEDGPLRAELGQYIADRNIPIVSAPDTEQRLRAGTLSPKSAGEVSMLEVATREREAGRITRIWSDDKYFDSPQIMRNHPEVHRSMSADLLDEAYEHRYIGNSDYRAFRDGYEAQAEFRPGESPRLNTFRYDLLSPEIDAPHRVRPAHVQAGRALGIAGLALEVYDGADSVRTAHRLAGEGNRTAAESELIHFGARSVGGWAGAGIGMAGGAALGVETGPGLLITGAIGGVAGVFAGDKFAEWTDNRRIYNQELGGNTWTYDPENAALGWRRQAPIDSTNDSIDNARRGDLRASPATENQLNYQATSVSVELVLGGPPAQRNPFSLPAEAGDPPSSRPTNWERDPETGTWQREVYGPFVERGMTPHHTETADDERAARLDRQAAAIVVENAANSPASIAARYEDTYIRNGWQAYGEMPEAVRSARTNIDRLVSSEGDLYERQANGRWVSDGMVYDSTASGRLHDELEATREVLQARLPPPREIPAVPPMDADARLRDTVAGAYRNAGVDASAEQIAAAAVAVRATLDANGLDPATVALQARPQADGRYELASLRLESDGKTYAIAAVTTPEEIERARTRVDIAPHAIESPSEQDRDARTQAQREANLHGLSQDGGVQAVAASMRMTSSGRRDDGAQEPDARQDDKQNAPSLNDRVESVAVSTPALSARLPDPRDSDHADHRLYKQIEAGVARIDASAGRTFDATSERLAMSTHADAKIAGITSADHIVLNTAGKPQQDGSGVSGGTLLFVVQGQDPSDPAARRSVTDVAQAVERPLEQSQQKLDAVNQQLAQQQPPPTQDTPTPDGPSRGPRV